MIVVKFLDGIIAIFRQCIRMPSCGAVELVHW